MSIVPTNNNNDNDGNNQSPPFDPFARDLFDSFLDFPFHGPPFSRAFPDLSRFGLALGGASRNSRVNWSETSDAHLLRASLSGEDVLVELVEDRTLQISTDTGSFSARFKLPDDAIIDQMRVFMSHGVLNVTVPKERPWRSNNVRVVEITGDD